ncbi:DUF5989 family protein [bacterium]|nr:DUF5989 family protein [bacterium]
MSLTDQEPSFEEASKSEQRGLLREFVGFMHENAKWWLTPFLIVFLILAVLLVAGSTGAAPFIYTLF